MPQFYTLLTETGQAKLANAVALGGTIEITELAVGDGGGSLPSPDSSATALINEVRRAPINASDTDPDNPTWIVVEQVLPPDVGGWTIREIGIYDVDGDLIGIGNYPETYKPVLAEGSSRTQTVRFVLEVSDTAAVTLKVDPSVVLATREYVDQERAAHEASRNHPGATESAQGMIQRATSTQAKAGSDNTRAMTPARVREAFAQFGLGSAVNMAGYDLDNLLTPGFYFATNSPANAPGPSIAYHVIVTREVPSAHAHQYAADYNGDQVYFRRRTGNTWQPWREFYHSGNLGQITASQDETNTGAEDGKFVTPKKLKAWVKQATESVMGLLKVATQAQTDAGTDDATAVTPKKLRWGVSYSITQDGFIAFPSWLGGFVIQWGVVNFSSFASKSEQLISTSFPIAFPSQAFLSIGITSGDTAQGCTVTTVNLSPSGTDFRLRNTSDTNKVGNVSYIVVGV